MRRFILFLGLVGLLAVPALAGVTARYSDKELKGKSITVSVADNGNARLDSGGGQVLIVRDGARYVVSSDRQGQYVARVEDSLVIFVEFVTMIMQGMEQAAAEEAARTGATPPRGGLAEFRALALAPFTLQEGDTETVGGRTGRVYRLGPAQGGAPGPVIEIVISTDADLAPVGRELRTLLGLFAQPLSALLGQSPDALVRLDELLSRGTPIRVGSEFRLESVSAESLAPGSFELPGPPLTLEQLRERSSSLIGIMGSNEPDPNPDSSDE